VNGAFVWEPKKRLTVDGLGATHHLQYTHRMPNSVFDPAQHIFPDSEAIRQAITHVYALEMFAQSVVQPSLAALDRQLETADQSDEPAADFMYADLADLFHSTVEGYLLTVQSMWERSLRRMLVECDKRLCAGQNESAIQKARWERDTSRGLQAHFHRLLGFRMSDMYAYGDLDLLQNLGNAIRHGDGPSARRVHELAPNLWHQWLARGTLIQVGPYDITIPLSEPPQPSFETATLNEALLKQMISAVVDFWMDLESLRCHSFRAIHPSTVEQLRAWAQEREARRAVRDWTAEVR